MFYQRKQHPQQLFDVAAGPQFPAIPLAGVLGSPRHPQKGHARYGSSYSIIAPPFSHYRRWTERKINHSFYLHFSSDLWFKNSRCQGSRRSMGDVHSDDQEVFRSGTRRPLLEKQCRAQRYSQRSKILFFCWLLAFGGAEKKTEGSIVPLRQAISLLTRSSIWWKGDHRVRVLEKWIGQQFVHQHFLQSQSENEGSWKGTWLT